MWVGGERGGRESLWGGFLWKGFLGDDLTGVRGLGGEGRGKEGLAAGDMKPRPGTKLKKLDCKAVEIFFWD